MLSNRDIHTVSGTTCQFDISDIRADADGEYVCYWLPQLKKLPNADMMHQPHLYKGDKFDVDKDYFHPIAKVTSRTDKMCHVDTWQVAWRKEGGGGGHPKKRDFKIKQGGRGGKTISDKAPKASKRV